MAIKKDVTNQSKFPPNRSDICWRTFAQRRGSVLRLELLSGRIWLLPYSHWLHADLENAREREQHLTISFTSHDICVDGENLKEVLLELQAGNVEVLRELSDRDQDTQSGVIIRTISVIESAPSPAETIE